MAKITSDQSAFNHSRISVAASFILEKLSSASANLDSLADRSSEGMLSEAQESVSDGGLVNPFNSFKIGLYSLEIGLYSLKN